VRNLALVEALGALAERRGVTTAQLAIAWVLSRGDDIVPRVGARRRDRLDEALGALDLELTDAGLEEIECAVPAGSAARSRYAEYAMAELDNERSRREPVAGAAYAASSTRNGVELPVDAGRPCAGRGRAG